MSPRTHSSCKVIDNVVQVLLPQVDFAQPLDYVEPVRQPPKPEPALATGGRLRNHPFLCLICRVLCHRNSKSQVLCSGNEKSCCM